MGAQASLRERLFSRGPLPFPTLFVAPAKAEIHRYQPDLSPIGDEPVPDGDATLLHEVASPAISPGSKYSAYADFFF
jgi:hypothetical protein